MANQIEHIYNELMRANLLLKHIAGTTIKLNSKTKTIFPNATKGRNSSYIFRSLVLLGVASKMLLSAVGLLLATCTAEDPPVDILLCAMVFFICLLAGERYRIRGLYPSQLVSFLNQLVSVINNKRFCLPNMESSLKIKAIKIIIFVSRYISSLIFPLSMALACMVDPGLPINVLWLWKNSWAEISIASEIKYSMVFLINLVIWCFISVQGYRIFTELLLGSLSLSILVQVFNR